MKNDSGNDKYKNRRMVLKAFSMLSHVGISMASCIIIGVLIGRLLDGLFGTSPWLFIVFAFIGAAAAFKVLYEIAVKEWKIK